jgi:hypothetical protein
MPPPPTTKAAIFYDAGYQCEYVPMETLYRPLSADSHIRYTLNATGYATAEKFQLHESQIRFRLKEEGTINDFQVLDFQKCAYLFPRSKYLLHTDRAQMRIPGIKSSIAAPKHNGSARVRSSQAVEYGAVSGQGHA